MSRVGKVFGKAQKRKAGTGLTPRVAAMTLQGLIMGLIMGTLEREPGPGIRKNLLCLPRGVFPGGQRLRRLFFYLLLQIFLLRLEP